jgi:hypothetical protein
VEADIKKYFDTIDQRKRFNRDNEGGAGGAPGRAVLGEAPARDTRVAMGMILELSAPGMQDAGEPREVGPDEALGGGQPFEGRGRCLQQGLVRGALMRADEGPEGFGDSEGKEEVRPGQLLVQVMCKPLLGLMLLTLGTVAVATGMLDVVLPPTARTLIETVTVMATAALLDGADHLAVGGGEVGVALQVCWRKGGEDVTQGSHGSRPCMRVLRRS